MKRIYIYIILFVALMPQVANAKVDGKSYEPGDTIILDGLECLVFKTDESGLSGKAMTPFAMPDEKEYQKWVKTWTKRLEKSVKKGELTQEQMDLELSYLQNQHEKIPYLLREDAGRKGGNQYYTYLTQDWKEKVPEGWRLPTVEDTQDFVSFYYDGNCTGAKINYKKFNQSSMWLQDHIGEITKYIMSELQTWGFYICDDMYDPSTVKFAYINYKPGFKIKKDVQFINEASLSTGHYTIAIINF